METTGMARRSKYEYLRVMWQRYQRAGRRQRSVLLDEVTRVCGYHRKYAIGLLRQPTPPRPAIRRVARRRPAYGEAVIRLLAQIWEAAGYLCGRRKGGQATYPRRKGGQATYPEFCGADRVGEASCPDRPSL